MANPHLPLDQTRFELVQTRKQEIITYYENYLAALREAEKATLYTTTATNSTVPDAPPTTITYP